MANILAYRMEAGSAAVAQVESFSSHINPVLVSTNVPSPQSTYFPPAVVGVVLPLGQNVPAEPEGPTGPVAPVRPWGPAGGLGAAAILSVVAFQSGDTIRSL
jgi:hypothetical protein